MGVSQLFAALPFVFFLGQASLTSADSWANRIKGESFGPADAASFCTEMRLVCKNNVPIIINDFNFYEPPYVLDVSSSSRRFFPGSVLLKGTTLTMHNPSEVQPPARPFLPYSLSKELKIDMQSLPLLHKMFGITEGSNMSINLKNAATSCSATHHTCVSSSESMHDLITSKLGTSSVKMLQTVLPPGIGPVFRATISQVNKFTKTTAGQEEPNVSCHETMFPSLLYSCHSIKNTQVFNVGLKVDHVDEHVDFVAACHADTSSWDANFPAFKMLGMEPGKGTVCHWIGGGDSVWVNANK